MNIAIRNANLKDAFACAELCKIPELKTPSGNYPPQRWIENLIKDKQMVIVAEANKEIVGFRMGETLSDNKAIAHLIVVNPKYRTHGVGSMLVEAFEKECVKRKVRVLLTYVYAGNKKTVDFFQKNKYNKGSLTYEFNKIFV